MRDDLYPLGGLLYGSGTSSTEVPYVIIGFTLLVTARHQDAAGSLSKENTTSGSGCASDAPSFLKETISKISRLIDVVGVLYISFVNLLSEKKKNIGPRSERSTFTRVC